MRRLLFLSLFLPLHALSSSPPGCLFDSSVVSPPGRLHLGDAADFPNNTHIDRSYFPSHFIFGALTLAVKHEGYGSVNATEKADSIWDVYARINSTVLDSTQPSNCGDHYDRYKEDIEILEQIGMDAYWFSIAWTRIFPNDTVPNATANADAIAHYNELIDLLLEKGIEPHVTLWAGDHPQALEDEYHGLLSARFIDDFVVYANACFAAFGNRVKFWITLDEPNDYASLAYASTQSPPGRCRITMAAEGPYRHSSLVQMRAQDFYFGWFMDPLSFGDYPKSMKTMVGPRLPSFTPTQAAELRASWDFLGLNVVSAMYAIDTSSVYQDTELGYFQDMRANVTDYDLDGVAIGEGTLDNPTMYITETGWGIASALDMGENLNDTARVQYFHSDYATLSEAIRDGGDVRGVFAWSLMDGFELFQGLANRFGSSNSTLAITTHSPLASATTLQNV
ncbi:hypothetical protein GOP47_0014480 [Adiantum capillus-veneris]|uniref:Beta-glucosidase n=1 Tax=Adiantum capillus-veneris TaxID=13818 RepID=A0A9D4UMD5_ADICA|nr:hypothetical protein GOP47_0014480 [Adiantum capillus-veneris]